MSVRLTTLPAIVASAALLGACSSFSWQGNSSSDAPPGSAAANKGTGARVAPPVNLAGKWTLASPGAGTCAVTLGALQDASEGTIAPAGGCPLNFFTSRKWTYEDIGLVIRDHNAQSLAQLAQTAPNRFDGSATTGQAISLSR